QPGDRHPLQLHRPAHPLRLMVESGHADFIRRHPTIVAGAALLLLIALAAFFAPYIAGDPLAFEPINRLLGPSEKFWLGTHSLARHLHARAECGAQLSLLGGT